MSEQKTFCIPRVLPETQQKREGGKCRFPVAESKGQPSPGGAWSSRVKQDSSSKGTVVGPPGLLRGRVGVADASDPGLCLLWAAPFLQEGLLRICLCASQMGQGSE